MSGGGRREETSPRPYGKFSEAPYRLDKHYQLLCKFPPQSSFIVWDLLIAQVLCSELQGHSRDSNFPDWTNVSLELLFSRRHWNSFHSLSRFPRSLHVSTYAVVYRQVVGYGLGRNVLPSLSRMLLEHFIDPFAQNDDRTFLGGLVYFPQCVLMCFPWMTQARVSCLEFWRKGSEKAIVRSAWVCLFGTGWIMLFWRWLVPGEARAQESGSLTSEMGQGVNRLGPQFLICEVGKLMPIFPIWLRQSEKSPAKSEWLLFIDYLIKKEWVKLLSH